MPKKHIRITVNDKYHIGYTRSEYSTTYDDFMTEYKEIRDKIYGIMMNDPTIRFFALYERMIPKIVGQLHFPYNIQKHIINDIYESNTFGIKFERISVSRRKENIRTLDTLYIDLTPAMINGKTREGDNNEQTSEEEIHKT